MDLETLGLPIGQVKAKSSWKGWGGETSWGRCSSSRMDAEEYVVAKSRTQAVFRRAWITARGRTAGVRPWLFVREPSTAFPPCTACTLLPWLQFQRQPWWQWGTCPPCHCLVQGQKQN